MKQTYYLAYGSNLNEHQMKYRCPNAVKVGTLMLDDYQLEFRVFLTIVPHKGAQVPIGVWLVNEEDEKSLDRYEGYPTFYRKEYIEIEIEDRKEQALVYIMNDVRKIAPPTRQYMYTCMEGYKNFGFKQKYLLDALDRSIKI